MKKKCLLILPRTIFPIVCGYALKNEKLIELLNRNYILSLILITNKRVTSEEFDFYKKNSSNLYISYFHRWNFFFNALKTFFSSKPIQVGYYSFQSVARKTDELLHNTDIAIGMSVRTIEYLKNISPKTLCVFDMVDSTGLNYTHSKEKVTSYFWKLFYYIESARLMKFEKKWIEKADITFLFNKNEVNYWSKYGKTEWLPHGVNRLLFSYKKTESKYHSSVAFIGKMDYQPNIDAIKWYIENVHIKLFNHIPLVIIGAFPTKEIQQLSTKYKNITVTGYVEDPYVILNSSMAIVAPMQTGGGIQNKVLESMALGKMCIISSLAASSIFGGINGKHFLIADTPQEYINILTNMTASSDIYNEIGRQAKLLIETSFTWDKYEKEYIGKLEKTKIPDGYSHNEPITERIKL